MRLDELSTGQKARIVKIHGHGAFRKRLIEMGFIRGREVDVLQRAPLRDPIKYRIIDYEVSLRRSEAAMIEVEEIGEDEKDLPDVAINGMTTSESDRISSFEEKSKTINVALIGNPNCGKTSMFNTASGSNEHVGNYSGVTVDAKKGTFKYGEYKINIIDLPGTYSLDSYSPEELFVRRYLKDEMPDVIINVVVASNLERNLYLTSQLIDMDRRMVIALNMYDELIDSGDKLDYALLGDMIGVPIVPTISKTGEGLGDLWRTVVDVYEDNNQSVRHIHVNLGKEIESGVTKLKDILKADPDIGRHFSPRYLAIKLLEGDSEVETTIAPSKQFKKILELRDAEVKRIEESTGEDITSAIAGEKYGFIAGALAETLTKGDGDSMADTHVIDSFVTNKVFGFPFFLIVMFGVFWATFEIGSYPMDWIQSIVDWVARMVNRYMSEGVLKDMIADGVIGGVGGVIVFLPNILILYFCISWMEDSGYMARAAFIMDKLMHRIGLHGKSFIPLVMGFGCNVPAILSSRSIESRSSRIITILINPFMSCSARLPIYVLLIGTFFSKHAALVFLLVYMIGILVAMATAKLLRKLYFKADETPFVMELPPYRVPSLKSSLRHMWAKGEQYLKKMGGVILVASIIVWTLNYFPLSSHSEDQAQRTDSYLESIGKSVSPVMEPIGFHWRATVAALAGVPAKEIVVSTLGVLYTGDEEVDDATLSSRLTSVNPETGCPDFTPAAALAFMVFILLYCPCTATVIAIVRETDSWRYGLFSIFYNTLVAWIVAYIVYRGALMFGLGCG
ncbi:MAG: ferrous iron transport protein B [Bacteroides sp.]|nr:ferrous iron transport protein B [Bacteroides sp.]